MALQRNNNTNVNSWNPFIPTGRDIARTDELASKNPILGGLLSFFFVPFGLFYLNRGINALKITGYVFAACFMLGLVAKTEEDANSLGRLVGLIGSGAITAEQVVAINKARQRQEKSTSVPVYSFKRNERAVPISETNKEAVEAVELLKQLKQKYVANEISEEEFNKQKQRILSSL